MDKMTERNPENDTTLRIIQDGLLMTINVIKALLVSIFRFFVSPQRKCVENKIVLVTGSGGCMGRQLSLEFSKLGAIVVLWDVNKSDNEETAKQIQAINGKCHPYTCDVGNVDDVYKVGAKVKQEVGPVDILINNAGIVTGKGILECPDELIEKTFNVNLLAHFWTVKCFLPDMLKRNSGHIVNISSGTGLAGVRNLIDYSASKFGVVGFTEVLNYEIVYAGYTGVHTTLVCPSFMNTKMFKGCNVRFPWLLAPLELQYSVDRIMKGILTNQTFLCIPRLVYFFALFKTLFYKGRQNLVLFEKGLTRIGALAPLELQYSIDRIMKGILTNQMFLCIPRLVYFFALLKTMVPVDVFMEINKFMGAADFMDNFGKHCNKKINKDNKSEDISELNGSAHTDEKKLA